MKADNWEREGKIVWKKIVCMRALYPASHQRLKCSQWKIKINTQIVNKLYYFALRTSMWENCNIIEWMTWDGRARHFVWLVANLVREIRELFVYHDINRKCLCTVFNQSMSRQMTPESIFFPFYDNDCNYDEQSIKISILLIHLTNEYDWYNTQIQYANVFTISICLLLFNCSSNPTSRWFDKSLSVGPAQHRVTIEQISLDCQLMSSNDIFIILYINIYKIYEYMTLWEEKRVIFLLRREASWKNLGGKVRINILLILPNITDL